MLHDDRFTAKTIRTGRFSVRLARPGLWLAALLIAFGTLRAQDPTAPLQGRVLNGTTNRPAANVTVQYILLQQGMVPAATAVTDQQGRFLFKAVPGSGDSPALLRAEYQGATYSQPVPPQGRTGEVEIQVFEAGQQPELLAVTEHAIFLHPTGDTLFVLEQVVLENRSSPPRTYVNPQGTYRFALPGKTRAEVRVSVTGPAGMPIRQTPLPGEQENSFALTYPIRPGETRVRLDYSIDYKSPFDFLKPILLPAQETHVVTPGTEVQITGEQVAELGSDPSTGFTGYRVVPVGNAVRLQVTGQAPATSTAEGGLPGQESGALVPIPDPVSNRRGLILALAGLVMLGGFVYHYTRS